MRSIYHHSASKPATVLQLFILFAEQLLTLHQQLLVLGKQLLAL